MDAGLTGNLGVLDVFGHILQQGFFAARVGGHLFHDLEDLLFDDFFFDDFGSDIIFNDLVLFHFGIDFDVLGLNVVLHDFELGGLLGHFHRLWFGFLLLGDFHHFLVNHDLSVEQAGVDFALVVALVLEGQPGNEQADNQAYLREHQLFVLKISLR